ncbi:MAG: hypothetical protein J6S04_05270 [Clostridia bacterium]|nr:hypothetical protein [Clostridia bacterium]
MEHTFSIGNGHTVVFSQGNLQYNRSNNEFRFALRQYEMLGAVNENLDDQTYDGWMDLFRFDDCKDLSIDGYRLLTIDEWRYILFHRDNAVNLFGFASIQVDEDARINGFIVLPDGSEPEGFKHSYPNVSEGDVPIFVSHATYDKGFDDNIYTLEEYEALEQQGAVFLPAGGVVKVNAEKSQRPDGVYVASVNKYASYWTSSEYMNDNLAYWVTADYKNELLTHAYDKSKGLGVRLAKSVL